MSVISRLEKSKESFHYSCNVKILQQTLLLFAVAALIYALYKRLLTILSPARKMPPYPEMKGEPELNDKRLSVLFIIPKSFVIQGRLQNEDGSLKCAMDIETISETEIKLNADITPLQNQPYIMEVVGEGFRFVRNFR